MTKMRGHGPKSINEDGRQLFRFLVVGGMNAAFGYGCYAIFLFAGLHYSLALFMATVLGVMFNFKSTGILVFRSHDNALVFRFVSVYVLVYFVNTGLLKLLSVAGVGPYIGGGALILPMALLSFCLNRKYVFPKRVNTNS